MTRMHRAGLAVMVGVLAAGAAGTAQAQIQGMPLFTNPRYATGFRVHADLGLPTDKKVGLGDYQVIQGGVTFALGPVGLGANVGATRNDFKSISNGSGGTVGTQTKVTASALAQVRVYGGGSSLWAVSLFGGASMDVQAYQFSGLADSIKNQLGGSSKVLTIPAGAAIGLKLPLVVISPNLWGSARMDFTKILNCPTGTTCPNSKAEFRWAVGLDVPILRIFSVRAAFDSGKLYGQTVKNFGVGASIGIGGMR
jgi:hypothetical protein